MQLFSRFLDRKVMIPLVLETILFYSLNVTERENEQKRCKQLKALANSAEDKSFPSLAAMLSFFRSYKTNLVFEGLDRTAGISVIG